jgi:tetratricopeptide (TPR) repeat protein
VKLSACLIVRNEAETLPGCLAALRDHVAEMVVVDTGSSDETAELAERLGARVLRSTWRDDFSLARNAALAAATGDYCLMVDADEVVESDGWARLDAFLAPGTRRHGNVTIASDTPEGRQYSSIRRLCRNDGGFAYVGRIHEQLLGPPGHGGDTGLRVIHSGYTDAAMQRGDKTRRNLALLHLELAARPDDAYVRFQLGRTCARNKQPEVAVGHFEAALRTIAADAPYFCPLVVSLGYALKACGRAPAALLLVESCKPRLGDSPDLWFLEGLLAMQTGDAPRMLAAFETCVRLGETTRYDTVEGVGTYRAHFNLGAFHELAADVGRARAHYQAALAASHGFAPAAERLAKLGH